MKESLRSIFASFLPGTTEYLLRQVRKEIRNTDRRIAKRIGPRFHDEPDATQFFGDETVPPDFFIGPTKDTEK
ncbi:MAG: hypothetical protein WC544_00130 [Patescibacteria group bacterium]